MTQADREIELRTIGLMIRETRKARGVSQRELSDLAGVAQSVVWRMEHGENVRFWEGRSILKTIKGLK